MEVLAVAGVILIAGKTSSNDGNFLQRVFKRFCRISVLDLILYSDSSSGADRCRLIYIEIEKKYIYFSVFWSIVCKKPTIFNNSSTKSASSSKLLGELILTFDETRGKNFIKFSKTGSYFITELLF